VSDFEMVSYLGVVLKWGEQKLGVSAGIVSIPIKYDRPTNLEKNPNKLA
jgi:hypothetical protein